MSLPFDIYFEEFPDGTPIKFKHDPESRAELKKKRTTKELLDIIAENDMGLLAENAAFNNERGFSAIPVAVPLKKIDDDYYIFTDTDDPIKLNAKEMPGFSETVETYPLELIDVIYYIVNEEHKIYVMVFDSVEEKDEFWDSGNCYIPFVELFLESTNIDTLHKLGKVINRGTELHKEFIDEYGDYDYFDDEFDWYGSFDVPRYEV